MLMLAVAEAEVKGFMNRLLRETLFDDYEVRGVEINAFTRFEITGILDKTRFDEARRAQITRNYCTWSELRPYVTQIIKGGSKPRSIKIIFARGDADSVSVHDNASALFLNMLYENDTIIFTTAVAQKNFALDKTVDVYWEEWVKDYFKSHSIIAAPVM